MDRKLTAALGVTLALLVGISDRTHAQWIEEPGSGWLQWSVYYHDTKTIFDERARQKRIFADGHAVTTSLFVTASGGLVRSVDAWVQAPVHWLRFDDASGDRERLGFGDVRIFLRAGPALLGFPAWPVAL